MKKIFSSIILSALVILSITCVVNAEDFALTVESVQTTSGTKSVDVKISLSGNPGIAGMLLELSYDDELTLTDINTSSGLSSLIFTLPGAFTNPCNLLWDGQDEDNTNGDILTLTFLLPDNASGTYDISVSYKPGGIYDFDLNPLSPLVTKGGITVSQSVKYGDITNDGLIGISDAILLSQYFASDAIVLDEIQLAASDTHSDGNITIADLIKLQQYLANPEITLGPTQ